MKIKKTRIIFAILGLVSALAMAPIATASTVDITGSGTWDSGTPTTAYSQAGATWQFSFMLPSPISSNPTTQATDISYYLNDTLVTTDLPGGVLFYSVADGGGFDLYPTINNSSDVSVISLLFPNDVGSNLNISTGVFSATIMLNDGLPAADGLLPGSGSGTVTITPEPPSIVLFGTALLVGSGLLYFRRVLRQQGELA